MEDFTKTATRAGILVFAFSPSIIAALPCTNTWPQQQPPTCLVDEGEGWSTCEDYGYPNCELFPDCGTATEFALYPERVARECEGPKQGERCQTAEDSAICWEKWVCATDSFRQKCVKGFFARESELITRNGRTNVSLSKRLRQSRRVEPLRVCVAGQRE